ncbi:MAG: DUF2188 domain-containing protein [Proteobacteria bacterium]|nr:DUF2188 domain-containing protein [Pseudomonadota bacterium]
MTVTYEVVEHDGGWAYRVKDVYSETFPSHGKARAAARNASQRQHLGGLSAAISYQDGESRWHTEMVGGNDRPETEVVDSSDPDGKPY